MRIVKLLTLALALLLPAAASAAELVQDRDYRAIPFQQPAGDPKKIEVIEFFFYGCPHCYDLQPALKKWLKQLPKDVVFRSVPAIFRDSWKPLARTFYALDALGIEAKLHNKVYDAIHLENINLSDDKVLFDWMAKQGVERQKFADAYGSFAMAGKVAKSQQMTREFDIHGTPSLAVAGKYVTSPAMTGGNEAALAAVDALLEKVRKERAGAKPKDAGKKK